MERERCSWIHSKSVVIRRTVIGVGVDAEDRRRGVFAEDQIVAPVHVRGRSGGSFREDGVVVEQHAGGAVGQSRRPAGSMISNVADPINRPTDRRLVAERVRSRVHHHVSHDSNVVHAAIDLEGIVVKVGHVVVVEID